MNIVLTKIKERFIKLGDKVFNTPSTVLVPVNLYEGNSYNHSVTRCCVIHLIADGKHTSAVSQELVNLYSQSYVDSLIMHNKSLELQLQTK